MVNEENALKCAIADYVSSELASCGIKANVKRVKFEEFQRLVSTGIFDAFVGSTRLPNDYDLSALLSTNGTLNYGHFTNQDLDNAIQAVNSAETPDEYAAALGQLQIVFNDQQPHIPLIFECRRLVYDGVRLAGDIKSGVSGQYEFENKWFIKK